MNRELVVRVQGVVLPCDTIGLNPCYPLIGYFRLYAFGQIHLKGSQDLADQ